MEIITEINEVENNNSENITVINNKEGTFDRLCKLQKLIKKESAIKELCKDYFYNYQK